MYQINLDCENLDVLAHAMRDTMLKTHQDLEENKDPKQWKHLTSKWTFERKLVNKLNRLMYSENKTIDLLSPEINFPYSYGETQEGYV